MNETNQEMDSDTQAENELCPRCLTPNELLSHFCKKCGRPLSSYAATGPFESIFAEGDLYRQASEKPRSFIIVVGMWLIFGIFAMFGTAMIILGREDGVLFTGFGAFFLMISLVLLGKTTTNYFREKKRNETVSGL
jgi:hypothetical protein